MNRKKIQKLNYCPVFLIFCLLFISQWLVPSSKETFHVSGKVFYKGNLIKGIQVSLKDNEYARGYVQEVKSGKNGEFSFDCENGVYFLQVDSKNGYVNSNYGTQIRVDGRNLSNIVLQAEKGCRVSGHIRLLDKTPIKGADVSLHTDKGMYSDFSDKNGKFILHDVKPTIKSMIRVFVKGFPVQERNSLNMRAGESIENVDFIFALKGKTLCGKVIDSKTKKSVNQVMLSLINSDGEPKKINCPADDLGNFCFDNVQIGKYDLMLVSPILKDKFISLEIDFRDSMKKTIEVETVDLSKQDGG
jgi:hypothetical protein